MFDRNLGLDVS